MDMITLAMLNNLKKSGAVGTMALGETITWDGDTTGLESVEELIGNPLYRISGDIIDLSNVKSVTARDIQGNSATFEVTPSHIMSEGPVCAIIDWTTESMPALVIQEDYTMEEGLSLAKGLYLANTGEYYISEIELGESYCTIDPKYLPEGIGYIMDGYSLDFDGDPTGKLPVIENLVNLTDQYIDPMSIISATMAEEIYMNGELSNSNYTTITMSEAESYGILVDEVMPGVIAIAMGSSSMILALFVSEGIADSNFYLPSGVSVLCVVDQKDDGLGNFIEEKMYISNITFSEYVHKIPSKYLPAGAGGGVSGAVSYGESQSLTNSEKSTARNNIDVYSKSEVHAAINTAIGSAIGGSY